MFILTIHLFIIYNDLADEYLVCKTLAIWRNTQEAEEAPLLRV